jgi:hypothetical protein
VVFVRKATRVPSGESEGATAVRTFRKRAMFGFAAPATDTSTGTGFGMSASLGVSSGAWADAVVRSDTGVAHNSRMNGSRVLASRIMISTAILAQRR